MFVDHELTLNGPPGPNLYPATERRKHPNSEGEYQQVVRLEPSYCAACGLLIKVSKSKVV